MKRRTFVSLLAAVPAAACVRPGDSTLSGLTMGTRYVVQLATPIDETLRNHLSGLIESELAAINRVMSTYDTRSELSVFNKRRDLAWVSVSEGLVRVTPTTKPHAALPAWGLGPLQGSLVTTGS